MKAWIYVKRNSQGQLLRESEKLIEEVETLKENPAGEEINIILVDAMDLDALAEKVAAEKPDALFFSSNDESKELAPRLAARLGVGISQDCFGMTLEADGKIHWLRPVYDNSLLAETVSDINLPQIGSLRLAGASDGSRWTDDMPIDDAEIVVCVGKGCSSEKGLELARELAKVLGAAIGATRSVTEAQILPISKQIGQTGKYIRPRVYIGLGVAGAIQHLAGMRNSDVIIAVNKDARAPIFEQADYGIVADLFDVVPHMIEELKKKA